MCIGDERGKGERERTCSTTRLCNSSHRLSPFPEVLVSSISPSIPFTPVDPKTLVDRNDAPYNDSIPGHRINSGVVKNFVRLL